MGILLTPEDRRSIDNLLELPVNIMDGREITLGSVADISMARGPETIRRENQRTSVSITGTYESDDSDEALSEVRHIMDSINLPTGYGWNFGRGIQEAEEDQMAMLINILLALACVFMLMAALFQSFVHPLVIISALPFAAVGVIAILLATQTPLSIMVMIGIVILVGVVVNNGIVLVDHINTLRREGLSREEAILKGGEERVRPILMTASTTILGLLPMALGTVTVGDVMYKGLALAVMGGLGFSTLLTLLVMPTYYVLAEKGASYLRTVWALSRKAPFTVRLPAFRRAERKVL